MAFRASGRLCFQVTRCVSSAQPDELTTALRSALKLAMKSRDSVMSSTIRSALSDIQRATTAEQPTTPISALRKAIKSRLDAASTVTAELAQTYRKEAEVLEAFLPKRPELSPDELDELSRSLLSELGISGKSAMGQLVKALRDRHEGLDGKEAAASAKRVLAQ